MSIILGMQTYMILRGSYHVSYKIGCHTVEIFDSYTWLNTSPKKKIVYFSWHCELDNSYYYLFKRNLLCAIFVCNYWLVRWSLSEISFLRDPCHFVYIIDLFFLERCLLSAFTFPLLLIDCLVACYIGGILMEDSSLKKEFSNEGNRQCLIMCVSIHLCISVCTELFNNWLRGIKL